MYIYVYTRSNKQLTTRLSVHNDCNVMHWPVTDQPGRTAFQEAASLTALLHVHTYIYRIPLHWPTPVLHALYNMMYISIQVLEKEKMTRYIKLSSHALLVSRSS